MPTPRFHPFLRLVILAVGVILASVPVGILAYVAANQPWFARTATWLSPMILVTLLTYPLVIGWTWFCRQTLDQRSFVSLGLRRPHAWRDGAAGLACGAAAIAMLFGVLLAAGFLQLGASTGSIWSSESITQGASGIVSQLALWMLVFAAVGFVEELLFRGYLFHNLTAWFGAAGAMWVQAVLFALVHLPNTSSAESTAGASPLYDGLRAIPSLVLIAIFFTLSYRKTGSLWFPIGFHVAWNYCLGCIFSLPVSGIPTPRLLDVSVSGSPVFTGGAFGPEASLLLPPIIGAMCYLLWRQPDHPQATLDLALLRTPVVEEAEEVEEYEEPHISRYKTSMRSSSQTLTPEVADTLRALREAKDARRQDNTTEFAFAPEAVAVMTPAEPQVPSSDDMATAEPIPIVEVSKSPPLPASPLPVPVPLEPHEPPPPAAPEAITIQAPELPTTPAAEPAPEATQPPPSKKPASPRW